jgi:acyl-CoA reductase-like NAD-dependent aldehyde dehydrogenase
VEDPTMSEGSIEAVEAAVRVYREEMGLPPIARDDLPPRERRAWFMAAAAVEKRMHEEIARRVAEKLTGFLFTGIIGR